MFSSTLAENIRASYDDYWTPTCGITSDNVATSFSFWSNISKIIRNLSIISMKQYNLCYFVLFKPLNMSTQILYLRHYVGSNNRCLS